MPKQILQQLTVDTSPAGLYRQWMTSRLHAAFTGAKARISPKVGGRFTCHDGYIEGINLFLQPAQRIVQAWRGSDWDPGDWSIIDLHLHPLGRGRTLLTFVHTGVPDAHASSIRQGWIDYYWTPLEAKLREKKPGATKPAAVRSGAKQTAAKARRSRPRRDTAAREKKSRRAGSRIR